MRGPRRRWVAAAIIAALFAIACTGDEGSDESADGADALIRFDSRGGDSFGHSERVIGQTECDDLAFEINGGPVDATTELSGATFTAEVPLLPGRNEVSAVCGEGEIRSEFITFEQRIRRGPTARVKVRVEGNKVTLDAGASSEDFDGAAITEYSWRPGQRRVRGQPQGDLGSANLQALTSADGSTVELDAPSGDGEYFVTVEVGDDADRSDSSMTYFEVDDGTARAVDLMNEHPSWIDQAIVYAPVPALWGKGGPKAVQRRLPYLKELGVNVLWLWPPTTLRASGEEYAINDFFEVDPSWGPRDALVELVEEAHQMGMYVIADFVPNHMSSASPYFKDAERREELSPYWNFFDRQGGEATYYFGWDHLPNLNYENPEVRTMIMESMSHWVRDIGMDGFRVDVAWGVKRRRPHFWPEWRREMKRVNPDLFLLAEATGVDRYYFRNGFDVAYDWTNELGEWAWGSAFESPQEAGALLREAITNGGRGYARDARILRFLNNNDTGVRFVDKHGPGITKVGATMQFTLPGIPALFAGDEIGASYEPYSNLTRIPWRDKHGLRPTYERLIELRKSMPALTGLDVALLESNVNSVLAYVRPPAGGSGPVLVVLNFGSSTQVELTGPAIDEVLASGPVLDDLLNGGHVELSAPGASAAITMPAESAVVLTPEGN